MSPKKTSGKRKSLTPLIQSAIAGAGSGGISPRDIADKTKLPYDAVAVWLISEKKKKGSVTLKKGKYILSSGKTVLPTAKVDPTSLILPVIGAAGAKGLTFHEIAGQTSLNDIVLGIWLCENTDAKENPAVKMKSYDKYVLTAQGKVNLKKLKGWRQKGDEIII